MRDYKQETAVATGATPQSESSQFPRSVSSVRPRSGSSAQKRALKGAPKGMKGSRPSISPNASASLLLRPPLTRSIPGPFKKKSRTSSWVSPNHSPKVGASAM